MRQPAKDGYKVIAESGNDDVPGYPKAFYAEQYKGGLSEALRFAKEEYRRVLNFVQSNADEYGLKYFSERTFLQKTRGRKMARQNTSILQGR